MLKRLMPILMITAACWVVFGVDAWLYRGELCRYGLIPRRTDHLWGILYAPFLHASTEHLSANTVPLLILGSIICWRGRAQFIVLTIAGILLGGGLTWLLARNASHVGASGLVFCYFGYLASLAFFRHTFGALVISILCVVAYSGMLKGLLPASAAISWEGHAAGFVTGVLLAWIVSKFIATDVRVSDNQETTLVGRG